jgi:hypothetical protein
VSVHATNYGSAGPGVEVAKNMTDDLQPLQARAGIVLAHIVKRASPNLRVVNHRGREGASMLRGYEHWVEARREDRNQRSVALPFQPASASRVAAVRGELADLIFTPGRSRRLAIAERAFVPPRAALEEGGERDRAQAEPQLVSPIRLARRPARERAKPRTPILVKRVQLIRQSAFVTNVGQ